MAVILILRAAGHPDTETDFVRLRVACAAFRLFPVLSNPGAQPVAAMVSVQLIINPGFSNGFKSFRHANGPFLDREPNSTGRSATLSLWHNANREHLKIFGNPIGLNVMRKCHSSQLAIPIERIIIMP